LASFSSAIAVRDRLQNLPEITRCSCADGAGTTDENNFAKPLLVRHLDQRGGLLRLLQQSFHDYRF